MAQGQLCTRTARAATSRRLSLRESNPLMMHDERGLALAALVGVNIVIRGVALPSRAIVWGIQTRQHFLTRTSAHEPT